MIGSEASRKTGAAAMRCWPESPPTWACGPECTFGWARIGTWFTPTVQCLCPFAVTSVLESHSNFGCTVKKRRNDERKKTGPACFAHFHSQSNGSGANQAH